MDVRVCDKCNTPLDAAGLCVTCRAAADGLQLLSRSGYASVKEMMDLLEGQGVAAEVEQVPARREEEVARPLWNLYAAAAQAEQAVSFLQRDWAELLSDPEAARAAQRGIAGVNLDEAGEIECPACGHRFTHRSGSAECPDCGLSLGAPAEAAPDEAEH